MTDNALEIARLAIEKLQERNDYLQRSLDRAEKKNTLLGKEIQRLEEARKASDIVTLERRCKAQKKKIHISSEILAETRNCLMALEKHFKHNDELTESYRIFLRKARKKADDYLRGKIQ